MSRTLASPIGFDGIGVHSGARCRAEVFPAAPGAGIRVGPDTARDVPVDLAHADAIPGATVLRGEAFSVLTPEHLLAALVGMGITDALILVEGPEVPILDGSAEPWCAAIAEAGTVDQDGGDVLIVGRAFDHVEAGGLVRFRPLSPVAAGFQPAEVAVEVAYVGGPAGSCAISLDAFRADIAWARTFALEGEVAALLAAGRGKGASLDNTVVVAADGSVLNPEGMRSPDEPVRHKLLDAVGDLALLGAPWRGRIEVVRGSHALHQRALRAALAAGVFRA